MAISQRGLFTSSSNDISPGVFELFSEWLISNENPDRRSFARHIKQNMQQLGVNELSNKAIQRLINQLIETYKDFGVGQYLQSNNPGRGNANHQK